ncbi:MAG: hypothetical protein WD008_01300 [Balneolaceae bacterium]
MKKSELFIWILVVTITLLVTGCTEDSTSGVDDIDDDIDDTEEPMESPVVPEATPAEIDLSYFQENSVEFQEQYAAFLEASGYAQAASGSLMGGLSFGEVFFGLAESSEAEFSNGEWEWTYTFSEQGETITLRLTAAEVTDGIEWSMYISGNFGEFNQNVDEFLFISGFTASDRSEGNWSYYYPEGGETPVMSYQWEVTSETEYTFTSTIIDPDNGNEFVISYTRTGAENTLNYTGDDLNNDIEVYWNTDTMTGYIDNGEEIRCWDDTFAETACAGTA